MVEPAQEYELPILMQARRLLEGPVLETLRKSEDTPKLLTFTEDG